MQIGRMYAFEWNPATDTVVRTGDAELLGELWGASVDTGEHFLSRVHPDDRESFGSIACGVTPQRPSYDLSYRYIHDNGSIVWLHERGSAFFDREGKLLRVIGITADITKSKEDEETLRQLGGRLISAQEEERRNIALELHDDIGQDLAVMMVHTEYAMQLCKDQQLLERLSGILTNLRRAGTKVRQLSHQLHASELEYVGLAPAVEILCREFSQLATFKLTCTCTGVPALLERTVALSLYRIVQEALHNAAKHASAKNVFVALCGKDDEIALTITDDGLGFDSTSQNRHGLGLISMRERMHLVSGKLSVRSDPGRGTTVEARVPR
jgi:signal transduction histidine kinase